MHRNPYSEAWNKTLKYAPMFPDRFTSLTAARTFIGKFVDYYKHQRHTGIGLHIRADVHYGHADTNNWADPHPHRRLAQDPTRLTAWSVPAFVDSRLSREFVNISES